MSDAKNNDSQPKPVPQPGPDEGLQNIKPLTDDDCAEFYKKMPNRQGKIQNYTN